MNKLFNSLRKRPDAEVANDLGGKRNCSNVIHKKNASWKNNGSWVFWGFF